MPITLTAWLACNDARPLCGLFLTGRLTISSPPTIHNPQDAVPSFRWPLRFRSECLTRPVVVATWVIALRNTQMRTPFRPETSAFSHLDLPFCNHTNPICSCHSSNHVCFRPANGAVASLLLIFSVARLDKRSSIASLTPNPTSLRRPPLAPIMSDPKLMAYLEGMKKKFWHERRHLQPDDIKLQWATKAAPYTTILLDDEAPTQPLELTPTQGQQMARQSTSKSAEATPKTRTSVRAHTPGPFPP